MNQNYFHLIHTFHRHAEKGKLILLSKNKGIRGPKTNAHRLDKPWSEVKVHHQETFNHEGILTPVHLTIKDGILIATDTSTNENMINQGKVIDMNRRLLKCSKCDAYIVKLTQMIKYKHFEIIGYSCECAEKQSSNLYTVGIVRSGVVVGNLSTETCANTRLGPSENLIPTHDFIWTNERSVILRDNSGTSLYRHSLKSLRNSHFDKSHRIKLPDSQADKHINHVHLASRLDNPSVIWHDGTFMTCERPGVIYRPIAYDESWFKIMPIFDGVYLIVSIDYEEGMYGEPYPIFKITLFDMNNEKTINRVRYGSYSYDIEKWSVDATVEIRRSKTQVLLGIVTMTTSFHLIECTKSQVNLLGTIHDGMIFTLQNVCLDSTMTNTSKVYFVSTEKSLIATINFK